MNYIILNLTLTFIYSKKIIIVVIYKTILKRIFLKFL
jgi:hypothetical protein